MLFSGLKRNDNESSEDCEEKLVLPENVKFNGVHHRFTSSNDRVSDLKSKSELKGFEFFIREDFLTRVHNPKEIVKSFY